MTDAQRHDQRAAAHDAAAHESFPAPGPDTYQCGDTVLPDQQTTGGFLHTNWRPCWNLEEESVAHQRFLAARERREARHDRASAAQLARTELAACGGISEREQEHSPFAHKKEIAQVLPHREAGTLSGVWIIFKPVPGLHAEWLERDIACYRARWAMAGSDPQADPSDPTLVPGAQYQVFRRGDHVEVLVSGNTPEIAELTLARARGELVPGAQTAER